jgi:3-hydroxyacyl-[acyl-carrier-protein] dehydratase
MLISDYYTILKHETLPQGEHFLLSLNPESKVYEGHFPNEPVCPGVCNMQMIAECACAVAGKELRLTHIKQCRFTVLITPIKHKQLDLLLQLTPTDNTFILNATLGIGDEVFMSLKGEMTE